MYNYIGDNMKKTLKKIKKNIIEFIKENWGFLVGCLIIIVGGIIELPYNIYMGGGIIEVGDRINIEDSYKEKGSFNLAYVKVARANIPTYLVSYIMGWEREPKSEMLIDENDDSSKLWDREQMYLQQSIDDATINAYRLAGKEVNIKSYHFEVLYVLNENTDIKPKDKILKINGMDVTNFDDLGIYIRENKVDDVVPVLVERDGKEIECTVKLYVLDDYLKMGIYLIKVTDYEVNPKIDIKFTNREGGSSGGFMLSLAIYNRLVKEDITHGLKIVGTGTIDSEGNIGLIDGVKYKLKGAVSKKADIFFVCKDNLEEALKEKEEHNYKIDIVEVNTLEEAVRYLESR